MDEYYTLPKQEVHLPDVPDGRILDLGGGGEGIVGLLKGGQVVAIDPNRRELEETTNESLKIVMDACDLKFLDGSFDVVTSFFTMMYIPKDKWGKVFSEARRVLKEGGEFLIWDASFHIPESVDKEISVILLDVKLPDGRSVETGYGCRIHDQDLENFLDLAGGEKFEVIETARTGNSFFLRLKRA